MSVGGRPGRGRTEPLPVRIWAVVGAIAVVAGIALLALPQTRPLTVAGFALVLGGAFAFAIAAIAEVVRHQLRRQAEFVTGTVERGMLDSLPPGRALEHLLARVYGESPANRDIATAVLGGSGLAHDGADLTISEHTEIDFRLTLIDHTTYELVMEQRYNFRNRVPTSTFVIFATSDRMLRDSIISGCRLPLFELWFVGEDFSSSHFDESVESMRDSVRVGIQFADPEDRVHEVPAAHPGAVLREVKLRDWGRYLSFFNADQQDNRAFDRSRFMDRLRIFEIDLHRLAGSDSKVSTIQRLTVRSTTLQLLSAGFCYWESPYPCYVERMQIDTTRMVPAVSSEALWFHMKPFTVKTTPSPPYWTVDDGVVEIRIGTWTLPGHGMALMWRERS